MGGALRFGVAVRRSESKHDGILICASEGVGHFIFRHTLVCGDLLKEGVGMGMGDHIRRLVVSVVRWCRVLSEVSEGSLTICAYSNGASKVRL